MKGSLIARFIREMPIAQHQFPGMEFTGIAKDSLGGAQTGSRFLLELLTDAPLHQANREGH